MILEKYVIDLIEERRPGRLVKKILYALSLLYKLGVDLRHWGYDKRWLKSSKVPIPVISIGNIVSGGTGKTPLVRLIAEELLKHKKVAILSRGFRSKIEHSGKVVNITAELTPEICGDEPHWLKSKLEGASIWVGKDRGASAQLACDQNIEVILLDDGMQYRALERNWEVCVMDSEDLFGKGYYLPRGFLRDTPKRLKNVDLLVINHLKTKSQYDNVTQQLSWWTAAPIVGVTLKVKEPHQVDEKKVGIFCGIGKPERFASTVKEIGGKIVDQLYVLDHIPFQKNQLEIFAQKCRAQGAELLLCTEKDAVKLPKDLRCCLPILPLEVKLEIVEGHQHWNEFIEQVIK